LGKTFDRTYPDVTTTEWYLTVRCTNFSCQRLIAFQKSEFPGENPNLRIRIIGAPSVNCPHCNALVRFGSDQIEHKRVLVTGSALL
jgi:hypothetical protein